MFIFVGYCLGRKRAHLTLKRALHSAQLSKNMMHLFLKFTVRSLNSQGVGCDPNYPGQANRSISTKFQLEFPPISPTAVTINCKSLFDPEPGNPIFPESFTSTSPWLIIILNGCLLVTFFPPLLWQHLSSVPSVTPFIFSQICCPQFRCALLTLYRRKSKCSARFQLCYPMYLELTK